MVADGDRHFLEILRGVIEREGHQVSVAATAEHALTLLPPGRSHLLVLGVGLPDAGAERLVRHVQDTRGGRPPVIVLMTSAEEAERRQARVLVAESEIRRVLRRPFPMFDLVDLITELDREVAGEADDDQASVGSMTDEVPRPAGTGAEGPLGRLSEVQLPASTTYLELPLALSNLQRISRLWAKRASGRLLLEGGPAHARGWMMMGEGGPLDSAGWELISAALHGGRLEFSAVAAPGAGDHLGLGAMVFGRARDPEQGDFLRQVAWKALLRVRATAPLAVLPLAPSTRRLLADLHPGLPLGELAGRLGLRPEEVGPDLHAIDMMGLVVLGAPLPARRGGAAGDPDEARRHRTALDRRLEHKTPSPAPLPPATPRRRDPDDPHSQPTDIRPGGPRGLRDRREEERADLRRRLAERAQRLAARASAAAVEDDAARHLQRLRIDLERLQGASAAVVLGIPAGASADLVREAAARLRARYSALREGLGAAGQGGELARQMLARIDQAEAAMLAGGGGGSEAPDDDLAEDERLLRMAEERIRREQWSEALRLLRRARDLRLDNAGVLSLLGTATMHDGAMDPQERREEALGLLLLAVQFAPDDGPCNLRLARFQLDHGDPQQALAPARKALAAMPDDPAAIAVFDRAQAVPRS